MAKLGNVAYIVLTRKLSGLNALPPRAHAWETMVLGNNVNTFAALFQKAKTTKAKAANNE